MVGESFHLGSLFEKFGVGTWSGKGVDVVDVCLEVAMTGGILEDVY